MHCVQLLSATPFCKNHAKLYFNTKHLKRLNKGKVKFWGSFFQKSAFSGQYQTCPKFLEYALTCIDDTFPDKKNGLKVAYLFSD